MREVLEAIHTPLFRGLSTEDQLGMKDCLRFFRSNYKKGQVILMESEHMHHVGIVLSGKVDMIKEDVWGGKTLLARMGKDELFGESFACGSDTQSAVTFLASGGRFGGGTYCYAGCGARQHSGLSGLFGRRSC